MAACNVNYNNGQEDVIGTTDTDSNNNWNQEEAEN